MEGKGHALHCFKKIHDYVEKNGNAKLKDVGLTLAQGHILGCLRYSTDGQAPLKELEKHMKVAQSTIAGMIARLEEHGFVETFTDPADKRIKIAKITTKGMESTTAIQHSMKEIQRELTADLTKEEQETLHKLLMKVARSCVQENETRNGREL